MMDRLVFPPTVDALVRTLGPKLTPAVKDALRGHGLDLDKPLLPAWPAEHLPAWLGIFATALAPDEPRDVALRRLGRGFIAAWRGTVLGIAIGGVLRVVGPRRSLTRITRAFRAGDNYIEVRIEDLGPGHALAHLSDASGMPAYYLGVLEAGAELTGAKNVVIELVGETPPSAVFRLRYEE